MTDKPSTSIAAPTREASRGEAEISKRDHVSTPVAACQSERRPRRALLASLVAFGFVMALMHLQLALLVFAWAGVVLALPRSMPWGARATLAPVLTYSWTIAATALLQIVHLGLSPTATWLPVAVFGLTVRLWARPAVLPGRALEIAWLVPPLAMLATFVVLAAPAVGAGGSPARLALLSTGEDRATHLAILEATLDAGGFQVHPTFGGEYPPGFHINAAVLTRGIADLPNRYPRKTPNSIDGYWTSALLGFAMLVGSGAAAALAGARALGARMGWVVAAGVVVAFMIFSSDLFWLFVYGFDPQIQSYAFIMTIVALTIMAERWFDGRSSLVVWTLAIGGVATTWFLMTPFAIVAGVVTGWKHRGQARANPLRCVFAAVAISLACALPVLRALPTTRVESLNNAGGVYQLVASNLYIGVMIALTSMFVARRAITRTAPQRAALRGLALAMFGAVAYVVAIRIYQQSTTGAQSYFYFKQLYLVAALSFVVTGALAAAIASRVARSDRVLAVFLIAVVLASSWSARSFPRDPATGASSFGRPAAWTYVAGKTRLTKAQPLYVWYQNFEDELRKRDVLFWQTLPSVGEDFLAMRYVNAINNRSSDAELFGFMPGTLGGQRLTILADFLQDTKSEVTVVTNEPGLKTRLRRRQVPESVLAALDVRGPEPDGSPRPKVMRGDDIELREEKKAARKLELEKRRNIGAKALRRLGTGVL